jgi:hypothetical protein
MGSGKIWGAWVHEPRAIVIAASSLVVMQKSVVNQFKGNRYRGKE